MWTRLSVLWLVIRGDACLLWFAPRHPSAPGWLKLATAGIVVYLLSPVDLIPDVVPILGWVDDVVLVPLACRWLLSRLPVTIRADIARRARRPSSPAEVVEVTT